MITKIFIVILLTILSIIFMPASLAQSDEDAYMILITFSEPISNEGIFEINNYEVLANNNVPVKIYKVGLVEGNAAVVLYTEKMYDWKKLTINVFNLKDIAGNPINNNKNFASIDLPANVELGQK